MTLSQRLKTLRAIRGLSQEDLAKITGIPNTYLSLMETGKVIPAGEWETNLRRALNWTPELDAKLDELTQED